MLFRGALKPDAAREFAAVRGRAPDAGSGDAAARGGTPDGACSADSSSFGMAELKDGLARLRRTYPDAAEVRVIGHSVLGRPIYAVGVGSGPRRVFVGGAFHANEWITAPLALGFVRDALAALYGGAADDFNENAKPDARRLRRLFGDDAAALFRRVTLWTAPIVNPDGVELVLRGADSAGELRERLIAMNGGSRDFSGWKANARGVDLNDQFPAYWEDERRRRAVPGPGPRDYTGEAPLTEPEAQAVARFTEEMDFALVAALHTQGREIYWNYRDEEPPEAERIARRMAAASGYEAVRLTGSDAGYKDWFIHRFRRPGFTIEAGFGVNPLPVSQLPAMYEEVSAILAEALAAAETQ